MIWDTNDTTKIALSIHNQTEFLYYFFHKPCETSNIISMPSARTFPALPCQEVGAYR